MCWRTQCHSERHTENNDQKVGQCTTDPSIFWPNPTINLHKLLDIFNHYRIEPELQIRVKLYPLKWKNELVVWRGRYCVWQTPCPSALTVVWQCSGIFQTLRHNETKNKWFRVVFEPRIQQWVRVERRCCIVRDFGSEPEKKRAGEPQSQRQAKRETETYPCSWSQLSIDVCKAPKVKPKEGSHCLCLRFMRPKHWYRKQLFTRYCTICALL